MDESNATIRLDQFLKLCGVTGTGGQAKVIIQAGEVMVNDEIETRRGRKLVSGDEVNIDGELFLVEREEDGAGDGAETSEGPEAADAGQ